MLTSSQLLNVQSKLFLENIKQTLINFRYPAIVDHENNELDAVYKDIEGNANYVKITKIYYDGANVLVDHKYDNGDICTAVNFDHCNYTIDCIAAVADWLNNHCIDLKLYIELVIQKLSKIECYDVGDFSISPYDSSTVYIKTLHKGKVISEGGCEYSLHEIHFDDIISIYEILLAESVI